MVGGNLLELLQIDAEKAKEGGSAQIFIFYSNESAAPPTSLLIA